LLYHTAFTGPDPQGLLRRHGQVIDEVKRAIELGEAVSAMEEVLADRQRLEHHRDAVINRKKIGPRGLRYHLTSLLVPLTNRCEEVRPLWQRT
jgi:hypothetical protein